MLRASCEMTAKNMKNYIITYSPGEVVLQGDTRNIHAEAYMILKRFSYSSTRYYIKEDSEHQIILSVRYH